MSLLLFQQPNSGMGLAGSLLFEREGLGNNEMVVEKKEKQLHMGLWMGMGMGSDKKWSNQSSSPPLSARSCPTAMAVPHWLLSTLSDLEERMKLVMAATTMSPQAEGTGDSFAARAESYYQARPLLLALLQDLYKSYIHLSDRYLQILSKRSTIFPFPPHTRHSSLASSSSSSAATLSSSSSDHDYSSSYEVVDKEDDAWKWMGRVDSFSDAESSVSYQIQNPPPPLVPTNLNTNYYCCCFIASDILVAELVMKNVECDMLAHEIAIGEGRYSDSSRKMELQKSLLEVLESERLILLNENARLGYRVKALVQENTELASESIFMKRKASELARCILKMREDQRVCMLSRRIEDLQGQIHGLEKRNKEYYEQLANAKKRDQIQNLELGEYNNNKSEKRETNNENNNKGVSLEACFHFQVGRLKWKREGNSNDNNDGGVGVKVKSESGGNWKKVSSCLWDRVKNMDMFLCGMSTYSA